MRYPYKNLKNMGIQIMEKAGLKKTEAEIFMENLLYADARGVHSHGLSRLGVYAKRVSCGLINAGADVTLIAESESTAALDGNNGIGAKIGRQTMELAIQKARKTGCAVVTVKHGNHFGACSFYSRYASEQGMIAIVMANSVANGAPFGGAKAMLGTNPFAMAVPAKEMRDFDFDGATSTVAHGKVVLAQKEGKSIPLGWGVDKEGKPTTDPNRVAFMVPFGGAKGYAMSLFIDIMCSCLAGALNSRETSSFFKDFEHPQDVGYVMIVIDPDKFLPKEEFLEKVDSELKEFSECPPAAGHSKVFLPGEIEGIKEDESKEKGIELSDATVKELKNLCDKYEVAYTIK